jgi:NDP-sugar pyrophosphorylase family protein
MKPVILAGGFGTRISEETSLKLKPMLEIRGRPIIWHILMILVPVASMSLLFAMVTRVMLSTILR